MAGVFQKLRQWWLRPPAPSPVFPDGTDLTAIADFVPAGFQHGVQILNDASTTMQDVIALLETGLGLGKTQAMQLMLKIHLAGGVLVPMDSRSRAQSCAESLGRLAAAKGVALRVCAASLQT